MPATYQDWLTRLMPPWLQGEWGGKLISALGAEMDETIDELNQARKSMMPNLAAEGEATDALAVIGAERQLEQGPTEDVFAYSDRLRLAWDTWKLAGGHKTLLEQLEAAEYDRANLFIVQRSGRKTTLNGSGVMVVADGAPITLSGKPPQAYAEFGIVFTADQADITWSEGAGFSEAAAKLNRLAWKFRPAKADFLGTVIQVSGVFWGSITWGSFTWGGVSRFIPPR